MDFPKLIVAFQDHYNTPGWTSQGRACPSCCVLLQDPVYQGYFIGEKSAVIYWLCDECTKEGGEVLERITANLTGKYRNQYFSLVYGDMDFTEDWGSKNLH